MISEAETQGLLESPDLIAIGMRGDEVRRRIHGLRTTFVRVFEIHVDAPVASLPAKTSAGEFRIVGSPATLDAAVAAVRSARALAGDVPLTGFSLSDLITIADASSLTEICREFTSRGTRRRRGSAARCVRWNRRRRSRPPRAAGLAVVRLTVNSSPPGDVLPRSRWRSASRSRSAASARLLHCRASWPWRRRRRAMTM